MLVDSCFFNDTATTEIYTYLHTLSLHDALPIFGIGRSAPAPEGHDDLPHVRVVDLAHPALTALGVVVEHERVASHLDVALAQRGQPVGVVLLGVGLAAYAEEAEIQEPRRRRQDALARHDVERQVGVDLRSDEHTSALHSLMRISYAVFCLK